MAERKAVNKYYPPDWDPRKGSVNKRVGQHPLRDRAKKLSKGILVIRFELPYNIWCGGCGSHVGMGVRYNAEKSKVGNYYSTPIYKFRMKCHLCDNYFEIQTDPQNHDYVILCGARRKEQRWDPVANEQIVPEDKATQKKLATDPMYKLEHGSDDHQKGKEKGTSLTQIEESRISMIDDYILNRMARDKFRAEKKQALLEKSLEPALDIELLEETEEDRKLAGLMKFSVTTSYEDKQKERRARIEQRPLFDVPKEASVSSSTSSSAFPIQRQFKPAVSRRGELKQKLGLALKASYKDPFKSDGKNLGPVSPRLADTPRSLLGIKLKSSKSSHSALVKRVDKIQTDKTSERYNQVDNTCNTLTDIHATKLPSISHIESNSNISDSATETLASIPQIEMNRSAGKEPSNPEHCDKSFLETGSVDSFKNVNDGKQIASMTADTFSETIPSNSGLQALQSSYTESDSSSESS